jgi:PLP dependent protein
MDYGARLRETLPRVREAIERAAERAARPAADVRIVAVTKGHPRDAIEAALGLGVCDIGENRIEGLESGVAAIGREGVRWHMVGRLQRRKVPRLLEICDLVHSVDSVRLAEAISRRIIEGAGEGGAGEFPVLVQVNTSGEQVKGGFRPEEGVERIHDVIRLPGLRVEGLMTMAPWTEDESVLRSTFRGLRELHERLKAFPEYRGRELSMGMTNDYTIAVEEGSTMVRLGTALFGERTA